MSISSRHSVVPFVAGESKAMQNQRLARVLYKPSKNKTQQFPSVCASVPVIQEIDESQLERLLPHVVSLLEDTQDKILKSLYESSDGTLKSVGDEEISIDSCIAFLEAESSGGRLTKEAIESWFDSELSDNLSVVVAEKLGTENLESDQVKKHLKVYKDVLSMLAGGKTLLAPPQIKGCRNALALSSNDDQMVKRLTSRLDAMEKKPDIEEMLEL